jgi:hypothetical protein
LRKRFDAPIGSPAPAPPSEPLVLFLDRSLGRKIVPCVLREAASLQIVVETLDEHFSPDVRDEEWLKVVGRRGWVVLTKDQRIRYRSNELAAVRRAKVRLFVIVAKDLKGEDIAQVIVRAIPTMRRFVETCPAPFIATIHRTANVTLLASLRGRD